MRQPLPPWGIVALLALSGAACAHGRAVTPRPGTPDARAVPEDLTSRIVAQADAHLATGLAETAQGHLTKARESFDKAVDMYLTAPGGAYSDARRGDAYRRTLEEIHVRELEALAAGDGFTERQVEPASIDEVAAITVGDAPASEETRRTAEAAVAEEVNDFPVELNRAVLSCIDLYQGRLREWFAAALARGGRYVSRIREILASEGVPQDLAYVALVESAFKPAALSRAKARGVWQFIPSTGRRYGLQQDWWVDERSDPEKATRAAARYLKGLYELFGDWNLALAGYNAGEHKVLRGLTRYKAGSFWELAGTRALRRETRNYVPLIHAAIVVAKAPGKYGFDVTPEKLPAVESVSIEGAVDLRVLSECADTTLDQMQLLNPELRRLATPAGRTFLLKVPLGTGAAVADCVAALPPEKRVTFRTHAVARGQTLSTIGRRYGTSARNVADANGISLTKRLSVGMELIIPVEPKPGTVRRASTQSTPADQEAVRIRYRIKPGDTLTAIASQYGTTVRNLQSWNGLRGSRIAVGGTLTIYTKN
ncbi:MAG: transglycosylase SLT domain-containing protein [Acidobacteria bacterium]|nr:transglycosylase SLT domain-containing protein [Acidobacteriota bacterium]